VTLDEAAAASIAGVALTANGTAGGTLTVTASCSVSDIWHYYRQWIAQQANFESSDVWAFDGATLNVGAWAVSVAAGAVVTGNVSSSSTIAVAGAVDGVYSDSSGTSATLQLTGLDASAVAVYDSSGAQVAYHASETGTYTLSIAPGATGTWKWAAHAAGRVAVRGSFIPGVGGALVYSAAAALVRNPDGTPMLSAAPQDAHVAVSFAGGVAYVDIGNAPADLHAFYNATELALSTADGMAFVASGRGGLLIQDTGGADYAFLTTGWRLRRAAPGDAASSIEAYVLSQYGVPVDESRGPVQFLTGDTTDAIAHAVLATVAPHIAVINRNVQKASLLIPATEDLP